MFTTIPQGRKHSIYCLIGGKNRENRSFAQGHTQLISQDLNLETLTPRPVSLTWIQSCMLESFAKHVFCKFLPDGPYSFCFFPKDEVRVEMNVFSFFFTCYEVDVYGSSLPGKVGGATNTSA